MEIFDPSNTSLSCALENMNYWRWLHGSTGETVCGGYGATATSAWLCETFDINSGQWKQSHKMKKMRYWPGMWRTPSDKIMVIGGGVGGAYSGVGAGNTTEQLLEDGETLLSNFTLVNDTM